MVVFADKRKSMLPTGITRFLLIVLIISAFATPMRSQIVITGKTRICLGESTSLKATAIGGNYGTTNYVFEIIDYSAHPPFTGGNEIDPDFTGCTASGHDDCFAPPNNPSPPNGYPIGFSFCFFNQQYDHFWVGSNGWIGFSNPTGQNWTTFTATSIPNPNSNVPKNCIFAPWQDWYPGAGGAPNSVYYYNTGVAPDRKLVVYWRDCPLFACTTSTEDRGTFMIVLNEQSSIIENFIQIKPNCPGSNEGATQGVHNIDGTIAYTATNRNLGVWTASSEGTRFNPSGVNWYKDAPPPVGTFVSYGSTLVTSPATTTVYYAVVGACDGTLQSGSCTVTVDPLPEPTITGASNACQNDVKTYTTESTGSQFTWSYPGATLIGGGGSGDPWVTVKWVNAGTHYLSVNYKNSYGCVAATPSTYTVTVATFDFPVINTPSDEYCAEAPVTFTTQTGKTNYIWEYLPSGATLISGGSTNDPFLTVSWATPGTRTVSVNYTDPGGCVGDPPTVKQVLIKPLPVTNPPWTKNICSGQNTNMPLSSSPPGGLFGWTTPTCSPNIQSCPGSNNNVTVISDVLTLTNNLPGTVTYHISPFLASCAGSTQTVVITVNPLPLPAISDDNGNVHQACLNSTVTYLTESSMTGYLWAVSPGGSILGGQGTASCTVQWSNIGPQWISVGYTDGNGCSSGSPGIYNVTVLPLPVPQINGPVTVCPGIDGNTYTALNGVSNFVWSVSSGGTITGGAGTSQITVMFNAPGQQYVYLSYTDANGCSSATPSSYAITVSTPQIPVISQGTGSLCPNSPVIFTTEAGKNGYTWQALPDGTITGNGSSSISVSFPTSGAKTLSVHYTDPSTNCQSLTSTLTVTVNPLPVPIITGPTSVCKNSTNRYFTASAMSNYQWSLDPSGYGSITPVPGLPDQVDVTWTTFGNPQISVSYTDEHGCTALNPTAVTVAVQSLPTPSITSGLAAVCAGQTVTYTTQTGASSYSWDVQPASGRTILNGGGTGDPVITIRWDDPNSYIISINYSIGIGCTAPNPTTYPVAVNQNPSPLITSATGGNICGYSTHTYSTAGGTGHTYAWSVTGGVITTGGGPTNSFAGVTWGNALPVGIQLVETIAYPGVSCSSQAPSFPITMKPWPGEPTSISGPSEVCNTWQGQVYSVPPVTNANQYNWSYSGSGITIFNNGNTITIDFSSTATSGVLMVKGVNDCGEGPASPSFPITVNALPVVNLTACYDPVTTKNAKPFLLKGGTPLGTGGAYRIDNPSSNPVTGNIFNPGDPAITVGQHTIYFSYTNIHNCTATAQQTISVLASNASFQCGTAFTDPRDGQIYATTQIGAQCWLKENLRYGNQSAYIQPQSDNCIWEKYCISSDPGCSAYGGLYQWDEVMQYTSTDRAQGFCPPGWHVPNEAEWMLLIDNISLGAGNGVAGSYLRDPGTAGLFRAFPAGIFYQNLPESFTTGETRVSLFWTTSSQSTDKAVARGINSISPSVSYYNGSKADAYPVRCLKD